MREIKGRRIAVAGIFLLLHGACGGLTGPSPVTSTPERTLTGRWSGGDAGQVVTWELTQDGDTIAGSGSVIDGSGWTGKDGRVTGTLLGRTFSFSASYPVGTLSVAGCSARMEGTLSVQWIVPPTAAGAPLSPSTGYWSMSGVVTGRGCRGPVSGTLTLTKP